jgi:hypothetical protein
LSQNIGKTKSIPSLFFLFCFEKYESFRGLIIQSIYSTPGVKQPNSGDIKDEDLISQWKSITKERTRLQETIDSLKKNLLVQEKFNSSVSSAISDFELQIKQIEVNKPFLFTFCLFYLFLLISPFQQETMGSNGRFGAKLQTLLKSFEESEIEENLVSLKQLIVSVYSNELKWQSDIESTLTNVFSLDVNSGLCI